MRISIVLKLFLLLFFRSFWAYNELVRERIGSRVQRFCEKILKTGVERQKIGVGLFKNVKLEIIRIVRMYKATNSAVFIFNDSSSFLLKEI